jgi:parallel beta-helix repeat protein
MKKLEYMKGLVVYAIGCSIIIMGLFSSCNNNTQAPNVNALFEKQLQEKFINAKEGDVIELPEGTFTLNRSLILDGVKNITIRGKGKEKTILSFKGQKDGAEGLRVTADGIVMEDFAIMDTKGDAIKVQDATNVTFRRIKTGWGSLHDTKNGSYGTYPVGCTNVLIEDCDISGASDAGVYVGQSKNIIVRRNHVHDNVAGIEIENCQDADVYENLSESNTGGILVFSLPELPKKNGARCRVFNNRMINNNTQNFGVKGTTVSEIPAGTGIIVMASRQCEVYSNEISGQNTIGISVVSYLSLQKPFKDSIYDPYCGGVSVYNNKVAKGTGGPDNSTTFGSLFIGIFGDKIPDIVYDGSVNPANLHADGTVKDDMRICFHDNGNVTFSDLDLAHHYKNRTSDASKFNCNVPQLNEVKIN